MSQQQRSDLLSALVSLEGEDTQAANNTSTMAESGTVSTTGSDSGQATESGVTLSASGANLSDAASSTGGAANSATTTTSTDASSNC